MSVAVLVAAHASYVAPIDAEGGNSNNVFDIERRGFGALLRQLSTTDRASAWSYNEAAHQLVHAWAGSAEVAAAVDSDRVRPVSEPSQVAPELYVAIRAVLASFREHDGSLPERRWLVVLSDGIDRMETDARARFIDELLALARAPDVNVRLYVLGFALGSPEPLVDLGELAVKTGGVFRMLDFDAHGRIDAELEAVARELRASP